MGAAVDAYRQTIMPLLFLVVVVVALQKHTML